MAGKYKSVADSLNFFSKTLETSDQDALASLVEDYFTMNSDDEDADGNLRSFKLIIFMLNFY